MGAAIAARLQETGVEQIVWNRSADKAVATGLPAADSPMQLASRCDVIISSLFDQAAADAVYRGTDGLISAAQGKLFIEMSTLQPTAQRALARAVRDAGGAFIECPVGGTTGPARAGQLLGLAGGEAADVDRARPLLDKLCRRLEHMGPVGSGALAKLAINLPLIVFWQALGEAFALAKTLEKDPEWMVQLFTETAGAANVLKIKAAAVTAALEGNVDMPPTFDIDAMRKDLRMMRSEAATHGVVLPVASQALAVFDEVAAVGFGSRDCAYAPAYWASRKGDQTPSG
jgi:3-hydroxyisobutyrate dehydrogenase